MNKLKYAVGSAGATAALVMGLAAPVGATSQEGPRGGGDTTTTSSVSVDRSLNVNGNCSGIIQTNVDQSQENESTTIGGSQSNSNDVEDTDGNISNSNSQSTTSSVSQSQSADVNFAPNCSTTNVTQQVASAGRGAAAPQVVAPTGGVHAGGGGSLAGSSNVPSIVGLTSSLGAAGLGLTLRRRAQLEL